jgi:hypothetical protein
MRKTRKIAFYIIDRILGEDIGDLIYSIEDGDYNGAREILRFLEKRKNENGDE